MWQSMCWGCRVRFDLAVLVVIASVLAASLRCAAGNLRCSRVGCRCRTRFVRGVLCAQTDAASQSTRCMLRCATRRIQRGLGDNTSRRCALLPQASAVTVRGDAGTRFRKQRTVYRSLPLWGRAGEGATPVILATAAGPHPDLPPAGEGANVRPSDAMARVGMQTPLVMPRRAGRGAGAQRQAPSASKYVGRRAHIPAAVH